MPKVTFAPDDITIEVDSGEPLLRAAMLAGVHVNASCGGQGVCGKCRIVIDQGEVEGGRSEKLSENDYEAGYRLACLSKVTEDVTVRIPLESQMDSKVLNLKRPQTGASLKSADLGADWLKEHGLFGPPFVTRYVEVSEPSAENNQSDLDRLLQDLRVQHEESRLIVDLPVIRNLPEELRKEDHKVTATLARPIHKMNGRSTLINVQAGDRTKANYGLAVDIGTTTVYGQVIDLISGEVLAEHGKYNNQVSYGEDVITRIMFANKNDGLEKLQKVVVATINDVFDELVKESGIDLDDVSHLTVAGNTTMTQLFLAIPPKFIRLSPYTPTATYYPPVRARQLGLNLPEHVQTLCFPAAASYVGGDVIAGVMGSGMYREEALTLFIDLGTNGEIVVGNKDWLACAACSAGPAFEGGGIKHGMRAVKGAIEDFSINPMDCEPMVVTIGMGKPRGICGSGLINMVASLYEMGVVNEKGKFNSDLPTDRIREGEDGYEYVLVWEPDTAIDRDITINEIDIDNLIRAKGAMYSGYLTLLEGVGLSIQDLDRVIIAGGFGRYLNIDRAITVGLMPELPMDKFIFLGNGSLMGARMVTLSDQMRIDVTNIVEMMTNFELSEVPAYMDYYMSSLFLPHTEQRQFPEVMNRVKTMHQVVEEACLKPTK